MYSAPTRVETVSPKPDLEKLSQDFSAWFHESFTPYVIADYANVCLKVLHGQPPVNSMRPAGDEESPISAQNRLRNVPRTYKREIRFKIISLYTEPFSVPWTQTFALHMLRTVFGTSGSAVSLNSAFASSSRTSKDRVDFKPVLNSLDEEGIRFLNSIYEEACQRIDTELLQKAREKAQSMAGSSALRVGSRTAPESLPLTQKSAPIAESQFSLF
ncbi:hypothetical protein [Limnobacter alexandrii]|uniref:hypothetical protein n=1 Tax=Limnobacter alexandrii TaxID=2570352 RepID=UPI00110818E4|nr:hypothetical protein [Limnobacter alexandrii]